MEEQNKMEYPEFLVDAVSLTDDKTFQPIEFEITMQKKYSQLLWMCEWIWKLTEIVQNDFSKVLDDRFP